MFLLECRSYFFLSPLSIVHQHLEGWAQKGKFDLHQVGQKWRSKLGD